MGRRRGAIKFLRRAGKESTKLENANMAASKAQPVIRTREISELGRRAHEGEFISTGVIDQQFQDHGIGENILNYKDVDISWRPYGWFTWSPQDEINPFPYTDNFDVWFDTVLEQDAIRAYSQLDAFNSFGYRHITVGNTYQDNTRHIASIFVRTFTGRPCDIQLRVEEYASLSDLGDGSPVQQANTGPLTSLGGNTRTRLSFPFTSGANPYMVLRVRVRRTGGVAGNLSICSLYNPMIEEVMLGQEKPSKFVPPAARRGELSANILEGAALEGFIWGIGLEKGAGTLGWNSTAGAAYVPGVEKIVPVAATSGTVGSNALMRYVYLESNADGTAGTLATFTTAPDAPYSGTARIFPGNPMRRFVGVLPVYNSSIPRFQDFGSGSSIYFTFQDDRSLRVLSTATPLASSTISCAPYMPDFARQADIWGTLTYQSVASTLHIGPAGTNTGGGISVISGTVGANSTRAIIRGMIQTSNDAANNISHAVSAQPVDGGISIVGFWYER